MQDLTPLFPRLAMRKKKRSRERLSPACQIVVGP